jgi:hypothetical protein
MFKPSKTIKTSGGITLFPKGAVTVSGKTPDPGAGVEPTPRAMPRDVAGSMPSNVMFQRVQTWAKGVKLSPAERIEGNNLVGPGRFVRNFSDRKTAHGILRLRNADQDPAKGA